MADDDRPESDELKAAFVFVPHGDPESVEWMHRHPGWVRFPATMLPRAANPANPAPQAETAPARLDDAVPVSYDTPGPAPRAGLASTTPGGAQPAACDAPVRSRRRVGLPRVDRIAPDPIEAFRQADTILAAYHTQPTHRRATLHGATGPKPPPAHPRAVPPGATAPHHPAHAQTETHGIPGQEVAEINEALHDPKVMAFLHLLRFEEHDREGEEVYRIRFGDRKIKDPITDQDMEHYVPKIMGYTKKGHKPITPAGAYQITGDTYRDARDKGVVSDFSPASQDRIAVWRIYQRGALQYVRDNDLDKAFSLLKETWSSLPGGAGAKESLADATLRYKKYLAEDRTKSGGKP